GAWVKGAWAKVAWVFHLPGLLFRINQRMEWLLVDDRREIRVLARNQPVARLQFDGALKIIVGVGQIAGERLGERERVVDVIGLGLDFERLLEMRAGL